MWLTGRLMPDHKTIGVPFVSLIAAAPAVSELLRRLHSADGVELASGSALNLDDIECSRLHFVPTCA
jgi:hypothetical protein